jgi:hypothetical protein
MVCSVDMSLACTEIEITARAFTLCSMVPVAVSIGSDYQASITWVALSVLVSVCIQHRITRSIVR